MSATTFLLILAGVIVVLGGFLLKSWFELSNVTRPKRPRKDRQARGDDDTD